MLDGIQPSQAITGDGATASACPDAISGPSRIEPQNNRRFAVTRYEQAALQSEKLCTRLALVAGKIGMAPPGGAV